MGNLSGGNQQKAVIAKFARLAPKVMVVDEPTQGVDVSGKADIGAELLRLARPGCAVLVASSDFDEIGELCDRVLVLDRGAVVGIFDRGAVDEEKLAVIGEHSNARREGLMARAQWRNTGQQPATCSKRSRSAVGPLLATKIATDGGVVIFLLLLIVVFSIALPDEFPTTSNLQTILGSQAVPTLLALAA